MSKAILFISNYAQLIKKWSNHSETYRMIQKCLLTCTKEHCREMGSGCQPLKGPKQIIYIWCDS